MANTQFPAGLVDSAAGILHSYFQAVDAQRGELWAYQIDPGALTSGSISPFPFACLASDLPNTDPGVLTPVTFYPYAPSGIAPSGWVRMVVHPDTHQVTEALEGMGRYNLVCLIDGEGSISHWQSADLGHTWFRSSNPAEVSVQTIRQGIDSGRWS